MMQTPNINGYLSALEHVVGDLRVIKILLYLLEQQEIARVQQANRVLSKP